MIDEEFEIRSYREADREQVVALWRSVFTDGRPWNAPEDIIARKASVQPELFFVGLHGETVAGTVVAGYDGVRGWVHSLAVHPAFRRRGLAGRLMDRAEAGLLELDCPKLNLQVRRSNASVVAFYESRDYAVDDVISLGKALGPWRRDVDST